MYQNPVVVTHLLVVVPGPRRPHAVYVCWCVCLHIQVCVKIELKVALEAKGQVPSA
jgi:hypothetical protein